MAEIRLTSWGWYFIPLFTSFIYISGGFSRRISEPSNRITHSGAPSPGSSSVRSTGSCQAAFRVPHTGELRRAFFAHGKICVGCYLMLPRDLPCLMDSRQPVFGSKEGNGESDFNKNPTNQQPQIQPTSLQMGSNIIWIIPSSNGSEPDLVSHVFLLLFLLFLFFIFPTWPSSLAPFFFFG